MNKNSAFTPMSLRGARVFVTGASGFIGAHLTERLVKDKAEVHVLSRSKITESNVAVHYYDGCTETLASIVKEVRPDVVFHLASLFVVDHKQDQIEKLINSNVLLGTQLLDALRNYGNTLFVNTGTSWQHYHSNSYRPVNLYAATKQAFEDILRYYVDAFNIKATTLSLFDTYGPGDKRQKLFWLLTKAAITGETIAMSKGEQLVDMVYIDDVVDAFICAAENMKDRDSAYEEYAVSSGMHIKLKELVAKYEQALSRSIAVQWGERPYRDREVMQPWTSFKALPLWEPKVQLEEGLAVLAKEAITALFSLR